MKKIAVIIVTYNAQRFLADCFGSLAAMDKGGLDVDVIVVDNASSDGTAAAVREMFPAAHIVESAVNTGFAEGNNIGIRLALERGAEAVYLLNHDTEVVPRFLVEAVAAMESSPRIGAVQSLLALHPETQLANSSGNAIHFLGFGYCVDYRRPLADLRFESNFPQIAYASGAAVLLRAEALRQVGLFPESFFMYHEDLDLSWRMRVAGWDVVLAPKSLVRHKYEFSKSIAKLYYMERNRYLVLFKNLRAWNLIVLAPWLLLSEAALLLLAAKGGWWRQKFRVYGYFLQADTWRFIGRERKKIAAMRRVGDRAVAKMFVATIDNQEANPPFVRYVANPAMRALWKVITFFIV